MATKPAAWRMWRERVECVQPMGEQVKDKPSLLPRITIAAVLLAVTSWAVIALIPAPADATPNGRSSPVQRVFLLLALLSSAAVLILPGLVKPRASDHPLWTWMQRTVRANLLAVKAILGALVIFAVPPLVAIGMLLGVLPGIVRSMLAVPIGLFHLCCLPFHAVYALVIALRGLPPDYTVGIYGAIERVERKRLYDPRVETPDNEWG